MLKRVVWIFFVLCAVSARMSRWYRKWSHGKVIEESEEVDIGCEPPWIQIHRSCMQFEGVTFRTWAEARDDCISKGGDLAIISDSNEFRKFKPELKKKITSFQLLNWWVGLNYSGEPDDVWKWLDGTVLHTGLVGWGPGEPNNGRGLGEVVLPEECGAYNYQGRLKDMPCSEKKSYICEEIRLDPVVTQVTTTLTTPTPVTKTTTSSPTPPSPTTTTTAATTTSNVTDKSTSPGIKSSTTVTIRPSSSSGSTTESGVETTTDKIKPTKPTKPTNKPTDTTTERTKKTKPTNKPTEAPVVTTPLTPELTTEKDIDKVRDEFRGCYAINYESTCPPTEALGIFWPRTEPGETRTVDCESGQATWKCDKNPTCWKKEPNVKKCASENIQKLSDQLDEVLNGEDNSDAVIEFTENLAETFGSDPVMSEQDIYQSTKLLDDVAKAKPKNSSSAKNIIKNVVKCGNSLVAQDKTSTWQHMKTENKKLIASSLLNSMETVTNEMMKAIDEPTVERIVEDAMEVELHVVDVNAIKDVGRVEIYKGKQDSFFVSPETLRTHSTDGLSRMVIINYNSIGELLPPEDYSDDDGINQEIISQVLSASIGGQKDTLLLDRPITYTFNTENRARNQQWKQMCSFWNFSMGYTGAWSQKGCSLKTYNYTHTTCECNHLTNFAILMDIHQTKIEPIHATTLSYITYVGIIMSTICLFLSWITFICLGLKCMRKARHSHACAQHLNGSSGSSSDSTTIHSRTVQGERNSIHKHLVFCLFVAEILFLAGIERTEHKLACSLIAGFLHFFFLASFTWMFIEGIHILFMLVQVFDAAKSRMKYYYVLGYGAPSIIVGVSAGIFHEGYGTDQFCWLTSDRFFIWSFAGPIAFILLVNLMILIYAMAAVCKHADYVFSKEKSASNLKGWIQGALALEVLLGLTWVFGYFYINGQLIVFAYLFTIFNSLQGLFIFVFHCILNKKVRKEYERFIDYRPTSTTTSNTNSKSANGSTGTQTYALTNTRKPSSGFVDLSAQRKNSSSLA